MRYFIFLSLVVICSCSGKQSKEDINGIWIPEVVDWEEGSFKTYHIQEDTVVVIGSDQKMVDDSIHFKTEPGFNVMKGVLTAVADRKYLLPRRTLYRFFKIPGIPDLMTDTISVVASNDTTVKLSINGVNYIQGELYTAKSKEAIVFLATRTAPRMQTHPEEFGE